MEKSIGHETLMGHLIKRNKLKIVEKKHYSESGFQVSADQTKPFHFSSSSTIYSVS